MRELATAARIREFMRALGRRVPQPARVYFTGGATALLYGWRETTVDVDVRVVPELDALLQALPALKEHLRLNVELVSPEDFIPVPPGWEDRSPFIARAGSLDFYHFDLYAQALAKVERSHAQDLEDVREMVRRGLVDPGEALAYFRRIEPVLYRYPAVDPKAFRRRVEETFGRPAP